MGRKRLCPNFAWRDNDPAYVAERENDRLVFRKIRYEIKRTGERPFAILTRISADPLWSARLTGKALVSWKRAYNKWRQDDSCARRQETHAHRQARMPKSGALFKRKNQRFTPENTG